MALGLAIDIAHQGWQQGDDLFSYMDYRLAAGIEFVAGANSIIFLGSFIGESLCNV